jgi:4-amino-4-deoxy-L-arabinose transferase-like glycosyltransferase
LSVVLYFLLARLRNEKIALLGVILLLFTPLYLAMWQRVYIDALAATALAGMGGGLYLYYSSNLTISNCSIGGNSASQGGGLYLQSASSTINNCTIIANSASSGGGL